MSAQNNLHLGFTRKLPLLLQTEATECGVACLAMVASYHGFRTDLATLRKKFSISMKGTTLAHIMQMGSALQFTTRPLRLDMNDLVNLKTPCILHWDTNHFVVLKSATSRQITVHDPAFGMRKLSYAEASKHFTGVALELMPSAEFKPQTQTQRVRLREMFGVVTGLKRSLLQILVLTLALEIFALVSPFFMQWVVDSVLISSDKDLLTTLGVGFVLLVLVQHAVGALRSWAVMYMGTTLNLQWMGNVFTHLLRLPVPFFEKRHLGDVVSRFGSVTTIQRIMTTSFIEAIVDGLMTIATLVMMLIYSPILSVFAVLAVVIYGLMRWAWYRPFRNATEEQIIHTAKQQSHFLETVRGVRAIKLFNRQKERCSSWLNLLVDQINADLRIQKLTLTFHVLNGTLFGVERIAVIWFAALLVLENKFSVGMLFAFIAYKDQFASRVSSLIDKWVDVKMLQLQGERLADIVLTAPEEMGAANVHRDSPLPEASIEIRNLKFRYADQEPYVLNDCHLKIQSGESVAIAGSSGCGKTTLLKIMLGILEPTEGEVLVGGIALNRLGLGAFRDMVGTVMQDDHLFAGSIADNISFFDATPDQNFIEFCAKMASVHEEIMAMPMAYNTLIGDMGSAISGGQQQRILLARALYKKPKILFLDEATSHLDVRREQAVNIAIQQLKLTRIIIAHRPETIAMAQRVIVLNGGKVMQDLQMTKHAVRT